MASLLSNHREIQTFRRALVKNARLPTSANRTGSTSASVWIIVLRPPAGVQKSRGLYIIMARDTSCNYA
jgi:hypothetical protein